MMNFDEFLEAAKNRVQETLPDAEVKIQQVNKLQGESYTGISVQPEGAAAAVTFNVSPAFERYQDDESQKEAILGKIAADAKQVSSAILRRRLFSVKLLQMPNKCLPQSRPFPSQTSRTIPRPRTIS